MEHVLLAAKEEKNENMIKIEEREEKENRRDKQQEQPEDKNLRFQ